jgi:hypothetical protein
MFGGMIAVTAKVLVGKTADKNGHMPVLLNVLAGTCPDKRVISGTVAKQEGFEIGKRYLVAVEETEADATYGRQFNFTNAGELTMGELLESVKTLGKPTVFVTGDAKPPIEQAAPTAPVAALTPEQELAALKAKMAAEANPVVGSM